jgi:hypothetical protein
MRLPERLEAGAVVKYDGTPGHSSRGGSKQETEQLIERSVIKFYYYGEK